MRAVACLCALGCDAPGTPSSATVRADSTRSATGEVPFEMLAPGGAAVIVAARVNGTPVELVLDTGATFTCVDGRLAAELALPKDRRTIAAGVGVGGAGRVGLVRLDSLRVGDAVATGLTVCTLDLAQLQRMRTGVRGLLGLNFLRNYRVTLDFQRQVVQFTDPKGL